MIIEVLNDFSDIDADVGSDAFDFFIEANSKISTPSSSTQSTPTIDNFTHFSHSSGGELNIHLGRQAKISYVCRG